MEKALSCGCKKKGDVCIAPNHSGSDAGGSHSQDYFRNLTQMLYYNNISTICTNIHGEKIVPDRS